MEALEALTTRVSAGALVEPAPDDEALQLILAAAGRAPDHGRLRPWRFAIVRGEARGALGRIMAESYARRHPEANATQLQKERDKPLRAPMIIAVGAKV